jgi:protocatechuate 3,4-dioxygenase beta subunit
MKSRIGLLASLAAIAGVVCWLLLSRSSDDAAPHVDVVAEEASPASHRTLRALLEAPIQASRSGSLRIRGKVTNKQGPVGGAVIVATSARDDEALSTRDCSCGNHCGQKLLACSCPEAAAQILAEVAARQGEAAPAARSTSAADGSFEVTGLDPGDYALWAVSGGNEIGFVASVTAGAEQVAVDLRTARSLEGEVHDEDDKPLAGALVTAVFAENSRFFEGVTGADGRFLLSPLPDGDVVVVAAKNGYVPELVHTKRSMGEPLAFELSTPRVLTGQVQVGAQPAAGARITIHGNHHKSEQVADAAGKFRFLNLRSGTYSLTAKRGDDVATSTVEVITREKPTEVTLTLGPTAIVGGRVLESSGAPVPNAKLSVYGTREGGDGAPTDAQGAFRLSLPPGDYRVRVHARGYFAPDFDSESVKVEGLRAGEARSIEFRLRQGVSIAGTVVDSSGQAVSNASVSALVPGAGKAPMTSMGPGKAASAQSDANGAFELMALEPGRYELTVVHDRLMTQSLVAAAPGQGVQIVLKDGAGVTGRVVDHAGVPQAKVEVMVLPDEELELGQISDAITNRVRKDVTDSDGAFRITGVEPGRYSVLAQTLAPEGTRRLKSQTIQVSASGSARVELAFDEGASIAGILVDDTGAPVANTPVHARSEREPQMKRRSRLVDQFMAIQSGGGSAKSRPDGTFELQHLQPGAYRVFAGGGTMGAHDGSVVARTGDRALKLVVPRIARLKGAVIDATGRPITEFTVNGKRQVSASGTFDVEASYGGELEVSAPGLVSARKSVETKAGHTTDVGTVRLTSGRTIAIRVLDASGAPIEKASVEHAGARYGPHDAPPLTDKTGALAISGASEEEYSLMVSAQGFKAREEKVPPGTGSVVVRLERGATLQGRVLKADGTPVVDSHVSADREDGGGGAALTKADGTFAIHGLEAARYWVSVRSYGPDAPTFPPQAVEVSESASANVELRAPADGVSVTFRILDSQGAEVLGGVRVVPGDVTTPSTHAEWKALQRSSYAPSPNRGQPRLTSLSPGPYTVFTLQPSASGLAVSRNAITVRPAPPDQTIEVRHDSNPRVIPREAFQPSQR